MAEDSIVRAIRHDAGAIATLHAAKNGINGTGRPVPVNSRACLYGQLLPHEMTGVGLLAGAPQTR